MLSRLAEVWDPLGSCAGVLFTGKILFQSVVRIKKEWDEPINCAEMNNRWSAWLTEVDACDDMSIGRSILPSSGEAYLTHTPELIGFSDGSSVEYGCALYLRWRNADDSSIDIKFLGAKSKVGPIGGNTVPRNELCGALMLTRLTYSTLKSLEETLLNDYVPNMAVKLFSDSSTILSWIQSNAINYKPFVKNKVIEIQNLLPISNWSYIPSKRNKAADLLSKGCNRKDLDVIVNGPDVLRLPESNWTLGTPKPLVDISDNELVKNYNIHHAVVNEPIFELTKYSNWKRVLRITSYVIRFIRYCKTRKRKIEISEFEYPSRDELSEAENYWIKIAQCDLKSNSDKIAKLAPFTDPNGIIRARGRYKNQIYLTMDRNIL